MLLGRTIWIGVALVAAVISVSAVALRITQPVPRYTTWESLEPDIWASAWLIKRFVDTEAEVIMVREGDPMPRGVPFGVPGSAYTRASGGSAFAGLTAEVPDASPQLKRLADVISFIESTGWQSGSNPVADALEREYRRLQDRFGRSYVPISCYAEFFDLAYAHIDDSPAQMSEALAAMTERAKCDRDIDFVGRATRAPVALKPIETLLDEIAAENKVVFVDTREPAEFREGHIPGAINLPLRHINAETAAALSDADSVIAYCIKDFRGFEAARELQRLGVAGAATMSPYGLAGWRQKGLPIARGDEAAEAAAIQQLQHCAKERAQCSEQLSTAL